MLLILLACGEFGLDSGSPSGDACGDEPVCITGIDPDWGPISGGTSVTVEGYGFEEQAQLFFGSAPLDITVITDEVLTLSTPSVPAEGVVDVTVSSSTGSWTREGGFTYAGSDPGDADTDADSDSDTDSDSDSDTDIQPTGDVEGLVELSYLAYACPGCFGLAGALQFSVAAVFHDPTSTGWYDHLPPKGSCTTDVTTSTPASTYQDLGTWAYLTSGAKSLDLKRGSGNVYASSGLGQNDLIKNAYFDLSVPDSGVDVSSVLLTPSGFDAVGPTAIASDDPQAFTAIINRNNATFTWSPPSVSQSFVLQVDVYTAQGAYSGSVLCHTEDTGSATLPAAGFNGYATGSLLAITMVRMEFADEVNPDTGNIIQGASQLGLVGTGKLQ